MARISSTDAFSKRISSSTRYETLLLKERNLEEQRSESRENAPPLDTTTPNDAPMLQLASDVSFRASMIGMLESHLYESMNRNDRPQETMALSALLESKRDEFDEKRMSCIDSKMLSDSFQNMSLLNASSIGGNSLKHNPTEFDFSTLDPLAVDVDDFFRSFPECERESLHEKLVTSDADIKNNVNEPMTQNSQHKTLNKKNNQKQKPSKNTIRLSSRQTPSLTQNNFFQRDQINKAAPNVSITWDSYNSSKPQSPHYPTNNRSIPQRTNSQQFEQNDQLNQPISRNSQFLTARELTRDEGFVEDNQDISKYNTSNFEGNYRNPDNPYQKMYSSEYERNIENDSYLQHSTQIRAPNLSAGLKRKYKPPKLNPNKNMNQDDVPKSKRNTSIGNQKIRQKSSGNTKESKEEDDLPEELQHLDKELVEKIEHEILDNGESVTFKDIAGLEDAKQTVLELVCWPMKRPDLFTGLRKGPNGLLLFGPPGTGKTLIGKAVAHESGATFFSISSSSLTSKWIGEGEKLVKTLFTVAMYREPAVVFIDEIDSLLTQRKSDENEASRRIKTEFLVQLDGTGSSTNTGSNPGMVLVIGATNRPHELDDAARRRFVKRIYIPLPERLDREILLRTLLKKNSHCLSDKEISKLSIGTDGYSGADLKALCTDAALGPIRQLGARALMIKAEDVPPISFRHFRAALRGMNPSVAQSDLDIYLVWNKTYGSSRSSGHFDDESSVDSTENE